MGKVKANRPMMAGTITRRIQVVPNYYSAYIFSPNSSPESKKRHGLGGSFVASLTRETGGLNPYRLKCFNLIIVLCIKSVDRIDEWTSDISYLL